MKAPMIESDSHLQSESKTQKLQYYWWVENKNKKHWTAQWSDTSKTKSKVHKSTIHTHTHSPSPIVLKPNNLAKKRGTGQHWQDPTANSYKSSILNFKTRTRTNEFTATTFAAVTVADGGGSTTAKMESNK